LNIQPEYPLENTFGLTAYAQWGCSIEQIEDVFTAQAFAVENNLLVTCLGAGSNVILQPKISGLVCSMRIDGIKVLEESADSVLVEVGAGVNWHKLVMESLSHGWFGLENLALIPGSVGAAPVQNIGAYGVEVGQLIVGVNIVDGQRESRQIAQKDCQFAYRSSVFKGQPEWIIVSVVLRLSKLPLIESSYPELQSYLQNLPIASPGPQDVADCVIALRSSKLPNPAEFANAGSFFKNPVVVKEVGFAMQELGFKTFAHGEDYKLSAAQLIDRAGWKGMRRGDVGCWFQQPLVIVNYGAANFADILSFAEDVAHSVFEQYQIQLELEPSVLP
jgi:UDP-N-acetylmuramate dehydrogenase|tara:strand:- start:3644 stop:4639 length:996 start_codon:yes stop_codon:yes gene_type:complete